MTVHYENVLIWNMLFLSSLYVCFHDREDIVMMNRETYEALQIFSQLAHPSSFKRGARGSYREGLSVYGIFNRCKSQLGCKFMRWSCLIISLKTWAFMASWMHNFNTVSSAYLWSRYDHSQRIPMHLALEGLK